MSQKRNLELADFGRMERPREVAAASRGKFSLEQNQTRFAMLAQLKMLWNDERGFVISTELILISTIVCLAMIVGLTEVSFAVNGELVDVANAYTRLNSTRYTDLGWTDNNDDLVTIGLSGAASEGN